MKKEKKIIVTKYQIKGSGLPSAKIALISDLHDRPPEEVLTLLKEQNPEMILIAGDLMERCKREKSRCTRKEMERWQGLSRKKRIFFQLARAIDTLFVGKFRAEKQQSEEKNSRIFLEEASKIAPVFYGIGNHERYFTEEDLQVIKQNRIALLDNTDRTMCLKSGQQVRIGGLSTRYHLSWLESFSRKQGFKILICHHPEYYERFIKNVSQDQFGLIVSGHAHGGQWRIGSHGILAPGQGLFPKYTHGVFENRFVISAGLANTANLPRFGNPRELVMIDLKPE